MRTMPPTVSWVKMLLDWCECFLFRCTTCHPAVMRRLNRALLERTELKRQQKMRVWYSYSRAPDTRVTSWGLLHLSDEIVERILRALLVYDYDDVRAVTCTCSCMRNMLSIANSGRLSWITREAISIHNCSLCALRVSISDRTSSSTVAEWCADAVEDASNALDQPGFTTALVKDLSLKSEKAWRVRVPNVGSMSCSSDGSAIALRCEDRVRIYDVPSGCCTHDFEWTPPITQLALDTRGEWMLLRGPLHKSSDRHLDAGDNAVLIHNGALCATQRIQPPRDSVHTGGNHRLDVFGGWFYTDGDRDMLAILFASTKDWALVVYASEEDEWQRVECFGPFGGTRGSRAQSYSASETGLIASVLTADNHLHILERSEVYGWEKQDLIDIPDRTVDNMQLSADGAYLLVATRNSLSILNHVEHGYVLTRRVPMPLMHAPRFCFARHVPHVIIYNAWQCRLVDLLCGTAKECAVDDSCRSITNIVWNEEGVCVATTDGVVCWHYEDSLNRQFTQSRSG